MSDPLHIKDAMVAQSRGIAGCIDLVRAGKWRFYARLPERHHHFQIMAERGVSTRDFPRSIIMLDHGTPAASVCESTIGFREGGPEMVTYIYIYMFCCKNNQKVPLQDGTSFRGSQTPSWRESGSSTRDFPNIIIISAS